MSNDLHFKITPLPSLFISFQTLFAVLMCKFPRIKQQQQERVVLDGTSPTNSNIWLKEDENSKLNSGTRFRPVYLNKKLFNR